MKGSWKMAAYSLIEGKIDGLNENWRKEMYLIIPKVSEILEIAVGLRF